ncbi:MAG: class I SAM-dependent methyltransferase, partial [Methanophagales archaeon]|nr:class I SAM-dependent methyltransferase [Methanophagales archaeon]
MIRIDNIQQANLDFIPIDSFWNTGKDKEHKMHRIHAYPAKFPAFITTKALDFATGNNVEITHVADVFCGCGTVAYEAKRNNIDFWGCDINPVATMIARTKSHKHQPWRLRKYYEVILEMFAQSKSEDTYDAANERLKYWYDREHYEDIFRLKSAIEKSTPSASNYRLFFICSFSNILKATSRWLTKSIKPQVDPHKQPADVLAAFKVQCKSMIMANDESGATGDSTTEIITGSLLDSSIKIPQVDMIITSPPYVTSYEYADLHQLSTIWFDLADDLREYRKDFIGTSYKRYKDKKLQSMIGQRIVNRMFKKNQKMAKEIEAFFIDMQKVFDESFRILKPEGRCCYVIGNTRLKGVGILNAEVFAESLQYSGFKLDRIIKREIPSKILPQKRDEKTGR